MDSQYRFGEIAVNCEGYDHPDDPYVLKGSCGVRNASRVDFYQCQPNIDRSQRRMYQMSDHPCHRWEGYRFRKGKTIGVSSLNEKPLT